MNIYGLVQEKLNKILQKLASINGWQEVSYVGITVEVPNDPTHGDLATNASMILAKQIKQNPRAIAESVIAELKKDNIFKSVSLAGPGFINMVLINDIWLSELSVAVKSGADYGKPIAPSGKKVNVEYVSTNPTGPMHVGHARGAIYGDVLSSLLSFAGYKVTREFYVNDAGNQLMSLIESVYIRYLELCGEFSGELPEHCYPGEYIIEVAKKLKSQHGVTLCGKVDEANSIIRDLALAEMMNLIKEDLVRLGVKHDVFFYESTMHKDGSIGRVVEKLQKAGKLYTGVLEAPKGEAMADWEEREQLLFKSTEYGDDVDRPLQKSNGTWTYFAADAAYLDNKISRGFDDLILVLGADHTGYKKRLEAVAAALNNGKSILDVKLCQLVVFMKDGEPFKMSKRSGNFLSIEQMLDIVNKDTLRFMMLTRKNDVLIEIDTEKVALASKDNPVFYVQYAYARGSSIIENAKNTMHEVAQKLKSGIEPKDLACLVEEAELDLIKELAYWPRQVELSAMHHEPHRIVFYLQSLAAKFHSFWSIGKESKNFRFIIEDNVELTCARIALVQGVLNVIASGLRIIGVTPAQKM